MNENPSPPNRPINLTEEQLNILAGKVLVTFFGNPDIYRPNTIEERAFKLFLENAHFFYNMEIEKIQLIAERSFAAARLFQQIAHEQRKLAEY